MYASIRFGFLVVINMEGNDRYIVIDTEDNRIVVGVPGYALDAKTVGKLKKFLKDEQIAFSEYGDIDGW